MRCECFHTDLPTLIAALTDVDLVSRWQDAAAAELPRLADRRLAEHIRALDAIAARIRSEGIDMVAQHDPSAADAWLTDAVAVATWNHWELPVQSLGERELAVEGIPRGLIAADRSREGAGLWVIDDATIALARWREAPREEPSPEHL